jgi:hypothetical protein
MGERHWRIFEPRFRDSEDNMHWELRAELVLLKKKVVGRREIEI